MASAVDKHYTVDLYLQCVISSLDGQVCGWPSLEMGCIEPQTVSVLPLWRTARMLCSMESGTVNTVLTSL